MTDALPRQKQKKLINVPVCKFDAIGDVPKIIIQHQIFCCQGNLKIDGPVYTLICAEVRQITPVGITGSMIHYGIKSDASRIPDTEIPA